MASSSDCTADTTETDTDFESMEPIKNGRLRKLTRPRKNNMPKLDNEKNQKTMRKVPVLVYTDDDDDSESSSKSNKIRKRQFSNQMPQLLPNQHTSSETTMINDYQTAPAIEKEQLKKRKRQFSNQMPQVSPNQHTSSETTTINDSKTAPAIEKEQLKKRTRQFSPRKSEPKKTPTKTKPKLDKKTKENTHDDDDDDDNDYDDYDDYDDDEDDESSPVVQEVSHTKFQCPCCLLKLASIIMLDEHIRISPECTLKCVQCPQRFNNNKRLMEHIRVKHPVHVQCHFCHLVFTSTTKLEAHQASHGQTYDCTKCEAKFVTRLQLHCHQLIIHERDNPLIHLTVIKGYICTSCFWKCDSKEAYARHMINCERPKSKTSGGKKFFTYKCEHCPMIFNRSKDFADHTRINHPGIKRYTCTEPTCSESFLSMTMLHQHCLSHTTWYQCKTCSKRLKCPAKLMEHTKLYHSQDAPKSRKPPKKLYKRKKAPPKIFYCSECPYQTTDRRFYYNHTKLKVTCLICSESTCKTTKYFNHMKEAHVPPYSCAQCPTDSPKFLKLKLLYDHVYRSHKKAMGYHCSLCSYHSALSAQVATHMKSKHNIIVSKEKIKTQERLKAIHERKARNRMFGLYEVNQARRKFYNKVKPCSTVVSIEGDKFKTFLLPEPELPPIPFHPGKDSHTTQSSKLLTSYNTIANAPPIITPQSVRTAVTINPHHLDNEFDHVPLIQFTPLLNIPLPFQDVVDNFSKAHNLPVGRGITPEFVSHLDIPNVWVRDKVKWKQGIPCYNTQIDGVYFVIGKGTLMRRTYNKALDGLTSHYEVICSHPNCSTTFTVTSTALLCSQHDLHGHGKVVICQDMNNTETATFVILKIRYSMDPEHNKEFPNWYTSSGDEKLIPSDVISSHLAVVESRYRDVADYIVSRESTDFQPIYESNMTDAVKVNAELYCATLATVISFALTKNIKVKLLNTNIVMPEVYKYPETWTHYRQLILPELDFTLPIDPQQAQQSTRTSNSTVYRKGGKGRGHVIYIAVTRGDKGQKMYGGVNDTSSGIISPCHTNVIADMTMLGRHRNATGDPITHEIELMSLKKNARSSYDCEAICHLIIVCGYLFNCQFHELSFTPLNCNVRIPKDFDGVSYLLRYHMKQLFGVTAHMPKTVIRNPFFFPNKNTY